jgi:hypothetical protein
MSPRTQTPVLHRLQHLTESDTRQYALGLSDEQHKTIVEQHITACTSCLVKLRIALRATA